MDQKSELWDEFVAMRKDRDRWKAHHDDVLRKKRNMADMIGGLRSALRECAMRNRYDGDLFDDQGNEGRRDASWRAAEMAEAILNLDSIVHPDRDLQDAV